MLRSPGLNDKEKLFVELYCKYGDPLGIQAAEEAEKGRKCMEMFYLTRPHVQSAIEAMGGPTPVINVRPLTAKEHKFIDLYLETLSLKQVAEEMGMTHAKAKEWMKRPHFKHELSARLEELRSRSIIKAEEVVEELALIAFSDITDYCTFNGRRVELKNSEELVNPGAISEVSEGQHGLKVKLHSKMAALENLAKYLGLFKERLEITGKDGGPIEMSNPLDSLHAKLDAINTSNSIKHDIENKAEEQEEQEEQQND